MKVWQVVFPDTKLQVPSMNEQVSRSDAQRILTEFMVEYIGTEIELVEIEEQADVTQSAEVIG